MNRLNKGMAAKLRETERQAARSYCSKLQWPNDTVSHCIPCWHCELCKGGKDCHGNPIGTREARIAAARAAVVELPKSCRAVTA